MLRPIHVIGVFLLAVPLMGMQCTAKAGIKCPNNKCEPYGEISTTTEFFRQNSFLQAVASSVATFDAAAFEIDVSQSTVTVPLHGYVTLKLVNSTTGLTQASRAFSWSRVGLKLILSDPDVVNEWALQSGGTADTLRYEMQAFTPGGQGTGLNTLTLVNKYEGEVQAAASTSWHGQICPFDPVRNGPSIRHCP